MYIFLTPTMCISSITAYRSPCCCFAQLILKMHPHGYTQLQVPFPAMHMAMVIPSLQMGLLRLRECCPALELVRESWFDYLKPEGIPNWTKSGSAKHNGESTLI